MKPPLLLPAPRRISAGRGFVSLPRRGRIVLRGANPSSLLRAGLELGSALRACARRSWPMSFGETPADTGYSAVLDAGFRRRHPAEGYALTVGRRGLSIDAASPAGLLHGVRTLAQLLGQYGGRLPSLRISDAPDFPHRGIMLDISRDKVPSMDTLFRLVDLLASWKLNQLQLYMEHTFAYRRHRRVWSKASPMTAGEIRALDAYCRERGVELVPNQNSFGHLTRWLVHRPYRALAEAPHGCMTAWGRFKDPYSLNPTDPRSLALLRELYDELLPNFSSRQFNVGLDETVDLGRGRSRRLATRIGVGRVYLDFLLKIHREVAARGRVMQFWGDIILHHPKLIRRLPRDAVAMDWGYEYDHPFSKTCPRFAKAGLPFYVCPGTGTWLSLIGRTDNALGNIANAVRNGLRHGAQGVLNTDWGDQGHWQPLPVSYLGYAAGAAMSWGYRANRGLDYARAVSRFAFADPTGLAGQAVFDLGNVYRTLGPRTFNASGLVRTLMDGSASSIRGVKGQTADGYRRALRALAAASAAFSRAGIGTRDAAVIRREYRHAIALSRHAARRGLLAFETDPRRAGLMKRRLARDLRGLLREFDEVWLLRNRPGGLPDSRARLARAAAMYRP